MKKIYIQPKSELARCVTGEILKIGGGGINPASGESTGGNLPPHPAPARVTILNSNGKVF